MFLIGAFLSFALGFSNSCCAEITRSYTLEAAEVAKHTATVTFVPAGTEDRYVIGSGWAIKDKGSYKLFTAQHVGLSTVSVPGSLEFCSLKAHCVPVDIFDAVGPVIGADTDQDWMYWESAEIPRGLKSSKLGGDPLIGDQVCVGGAPLGRVGEVTCGQVTNDLDSVFYVDARVLPGNSGGPVFDDRGKVIGMLIALDFPLKEGLSPVETSGIAIKVDQMWK